MGKNDATKRPDEAEQREQTLVDAASEYSFPASDPPSYMGGTAVAGAPPEDGVHREPVSTKLVDPEVGKPEGNASPSSDLARAGGEPVPQHSGRNNP